MEALARKHGLTIKEFDLNDVESSQVLCHQDDNHSNNYKNENDEDEEEEEELMGDEEEEEEELSRSQLNPIEVSYVNAYR